MFKKRFFLAMALAVYGFSLASPSESKTSADHTNLWPNLYAFEIPYLFPALQCVGGGSETFSNLGSSASSYATRTWTGNNGVAWSATDARTDQDLTGDAIALRTSTLKNTSTVAGGIGTLTFNYKRVFTGNSTLKVYVNGVQYGGDITVSSETTAVYSQLINVAGNVVIEIKNSGNRTIVDDLTWNCYEVPVSGPELQLADALNVNQDCGLAIDFGSSAINTNADVIFTIKNIGTAALNVSALSLSNPTDFSIVSPTAPFSVAASGSQIVLVRFNSASSGSKTSVLTIANNDSNEASCTVSLEGTALSPCIVPTAENPELAATSILATAANFTVSSVTADAYLAVLTSGAAPSANPSNGVNYIVGDGLGGGTVVYNGSAANFSLTSLTENTEYAVYVFPYNTVDCTEGPLYYTEESIATSFSTPVAPCIGGSETFTSTGSSTSSYATRTWTGDNGVAWSATDARTDQDLTGDAIAVRTGTVTNTTAVAGGIGTLTFNYKRVFTGNSTLKVFVNGIQYGGDITVSADTTTLFSKAINVTGNVTVEIRNSGNRTVIDDIAWNCYSGSAKAAPANVKVFPNPNHGQFQLVSDNKKQTIEVYNFSGNLILKQEVSGDETIDLKGAPKGIYLLKVRSGETVNDKKIIVE